MSDTSARPHPPVRRATRRTDGSLVGGVASGLAEHLRLQPLHVRAAFVVLSWFGGLGVALYAVLWLLLPPDSGGRDEPAGIAAATRQGRRTPRSGSGDYGQLVALGMLGVGVLLLAQRAGLGVSQRFFWPLILAALGVAVIWRQADASSRLRPGQAASSRSTGSIVRFGWLAMLRLLLGLALVGAAIAAFLTESGRTQLLDDVLLAVGIGLAGVALIVGPSILRLSSELRTERAERIRSQERADLAAHLHDSVLQTLALIQKQPDDPRRVATLARSQERQLRGWLYQGDRPAAESVRAALLRMAGELEDAHEVEVDVVTVGDAPLDERLNALLGATREALVNAAKHSGADRVDVYVEALDDQVEVFVRDRGRGFDPARVPSDRLGLRKSIEARMARHGGSAEVRSTPGLGTEVHLEMPRLPPPTVASSRAAAGSHVQPEGER